MGTIINVPDDFGIIFYNFLLLIRKYVLCMTIPALYNQYDLVLLRDKYHTNDIKPGITGLAQVKGSDESPIEIKA